MCCHRDLHLFWIKYFSRLGGSYETQSMHGYPLIKVIMWLIFIKLTKWLDKIKFFDFINFIKIKISLAPDKWHEKLRLSIMTKLT